MPGGEGVVDSDSPHLLWTLKCRILQLPMCPSHTPRVSVALVARVHRCQPSSSLPAHPRARNSLQGFSKLLAVRFASALARTGNDFIRRFAHVLKTRDVSVTQPQTRHFPMVTQVQPQSLMTFARGENVLKEKFTQPWS